MTPYLVAKASGIAAALFLSVVSVWFSSTWLSPRTVEPKPFPFRYVESNNRRNCVPGQRIINTSEFINDLYLKHNIRFFPRNGFLLGIVRHGGFLPNENVDDDLAVVYEDVLKLHGLQEGKGGTMTGKVGDFDITLEPTKETWVNWHGVVPGTQDERYPFHSVTFSRGRVKMTAYAVYPYHDTGKYFYPRSNKAGLNHAPHTMDSLRYNEQGGDYRLVDTDVRISQSNFKIGDTAQVGSFFDTNLHCFTEAQFYFTTIYVPCDYDKILTSFYGENWRQVENRDHGSARTETQVLSEEKSNEILALGPKPICAT